MSTILVPVDFSDCSYILVSEALAAAKAEGATLRLLHVLEGVGVEEGAVIQIEGEARSISDHLMADAEAQLRTYADQLAEVEAESRVVRGHPAAEIIKAAEAPEISKILMMTKGRRGMMRLMYGSVTEAVQAGASKPVVIFKTERKEACEARSCATCASGVTEARRQARAEADG